MSAGFALVVSPPLIDSKDLVKDKGMDNDCVWLLESALETSAGHHTVLSWCVVTFYICV